MSMDTRKGGFVCCHLLENEDEDLYRQFTGLGAAYNLICAQCRENAETLAASLREVSEEKFKEMDRYCQGLLGEAEILERASTLKFSHTLIQSDQPLPAAIVAIQPENGVETSTWIAVLVSGEIVRMDLDNGLLSRLSTVTSPKIDFSQKVAIHLSPDNRLLAIVNERGSFGTIIDLVTGEPTMELNRGEYQVGHSDFPAAFFQRNNEPFIVHGTAWNRLDISDPRTGKLITERSFPLYQKGDPRPEHYLDYFHSLPVISPDSRWIVEDGWVWQPFGVTRLWSLERWLTQNVWESEDGNSLKLFNWRDYSWGLPLCWISNQIFAIWGFGDDDYCMVPAVQLFDVETGKLLRWFTGPKRGGLYFDTYLFSTSNDGTDVWDIETGERLLSDPDVKPIAYHPGTHQWLSLLPDSTFRLSVLI